jgi:hypothetical protein
VKVIGANYTRAGELPPVAMETPKRLRERVPVYRDAPEAYWSTRVRRYYEQPRLESSHSLLTHSSRQTAG